MIALIFFKLVEELAGCIHRYKMRGYYFAKDPLRAILADAERKGVPILAADATF